MQRDYIDIYCERTGPEYWSEPINAISNLSFVIAAVFLARVIRKQGGQGRSDSVPWVLCMLIFMIGVGSWLFHTHATVWALALDVIPIVLFILLYTWFALRRFASAPVWVCAVGVLTVLGVAMAVPALTDFEGGSYIAALLALLSIGGFLNFVRSHVAGKVLLLAAAMFFVSLTLRTMDLPLCGEFALGTHFVWHCFNAVVLFIVGRAMALYGRGIRFKGPDTPDNGNRRISPIKQREKT